MNEKGDGAGKASPHEERPKKRGARKKKPASAAKGERRRKPRAASEPSVPPPGVRVEDEELEAVADATTTPEPWAMASSEASQVDPVGRPDALGGLGALLADADLDDADPVARRRAIEALREIAKRLAPDGGAAPVDDTGGLGSARELFNTDYYLRRWGRMALRNRSEEVDDFGFDPRYDARVASLFEAMYARWFRAQTEGLEHIPAQGRALLVSNHSGTVPLDGVMLKMAVRLGHPRTELRWLAEDFVFHMPFLGAFMNRIGAVRACQENAERLLKQEKLVAVFPEGIKGIGKLYRDRYRLQRFGRGGYIKLALRTGSPVLPTAVIGGEETSPMLFKVRRLSRALGLPYVPVTPTFPLLGPLGLVPLPSRWRIIVGPPIDFSELGPDAAEDAVLVNRLNEQVRTTIQAMIDAALVQRRTVFFG